MTRQQITAWTIPVIVFSAATLIALALRHVALRLLARNSAAHDFSSVVLQTLRLPSVLWCVAAGLSIAVHSAQTPAAFDYWAQKTIGAFIIVSISLVIGAMAVRTVFLYGERKRIPFAAAGLSRTLIYLLIFSVAMVMVLAHFGVQVAPILTALGVGGLAVALALQDTLANLFAGIHILVEEPISVGDFIELADGQRGTVRDIGWRTTRIQTFGNNILVIPNQKITSGILTNYSLYDPRVIVEVIIVAAHQANPDRIAAIAMDAAAETEGALEDPPPVVLFDPGVMTTHIQMKVLVHVATIADRGRVQSEIRARVCIAFQNEGIPFPEVRAG